MGAQSRTASTRTHRKQAGWDRDLLALEAADLSELGVDLTDLGFDAGEIDALLRDGMADPREDDVPEAPAEPVSRSGDLWVLGRHRLLCGDATMAADVARLLGDVRPHLMVTDPPYGVAYDPAWRNEVGASETKRTGRPSATGRLAVSCPWDGPASIRMRTAVPETLFVRMGFQPISATVNRAAANQR